MQRGGRDYADGVNSDGMQLPFDGGSGPSPVACFLQACQGGGSEERQKTKRIVSLCIRHAIGRSKSCIINTIGHQLATNIAGFSASCGASVRSSPLRTIADCPGGCPVSILAWNGAK